MSAFMLGRPTSGFRGGLAAVALLVAASCPQPVAAEETLTVASWGGSLQKAYDQAWFQPFQEANPGVRIVYDTMDYAKLKAMVESGNVTWDVADIEENFGLGSTEYLLEKIDCTVVPCSEMQPDKLKTTGYRIPNLMASIALGYNTEKMPKGKIPQGWVDFFDTKTFPGKRVIMMDTGSFPMEQALMGDGVDQASMYPLDIDRALAKLNSLGSDLIIAPSYQGCAELVAAGDAVMGGCWNGRFYDVKNRAKAPVEIQWNQVVISPGYLVIPKGSKNKDLAMKFIAFVSSAEHNGSVSKYLPYGPTNPKAMANVPPEQVENLPSSHIDKGFFPNDVWYDGNQVEVAKRWAEWVAGLK
jgi:putative spermidine/putrescine transport system substrate-binding protein